MDVSIFLSNNEKYRATTVVKKEINSSILMDINMKVPEQGDFHQVAHDWQLAEFGYKPRQMSMSTPNRAFPATRPLDECKKQPFSDFVPMLYSWQWRLYELFRYLVGSIPEDGEPEYYWITDPNHRGKQIIVSKGTNGAYPQYPVGTLRNAYMDFILDSRFLTDNHAFNTLYELPSEAFRDDVLGLNLQGINPWMMKCLTFTGNIINRVNPQPEGTTYPHVAIETFDYTKEAPSLDWILKNKQHLIWWTTEQAGAPGELPPLNGKRRWIVARTPQLKVVCQHYGLPEVGTPYFAIGRGTTNWIDMSYISKVQNGASYSPYVPEK